MLKLQEKYTTVVAQQFQNNALFRVVRTAFTDVVKRSYPSCLVKAKKNYAANNIYISTQPDTQVQFHSITIAQQSTYLRTIGS